MAWQAGAHRPCGFSWQQAMPPPLPVVGACAAPAIVPRQPPGLPHVHMPPLFFLPVPVQHTQELAVAEAAAAAAADSGAMGLEAALRRQPIPQPASLAVPPLLLHHQQSQWQHWQAWQQQQPSARAQLPPMQGPPPQAQPQHATAPCASHALILSSSSTLAPLPRVGLLMQQLQGLGVQGLESLSRPTMGQAIALFASPAAAAAACAALDGAKVRLCGCARHVEG